MKKRKMEIDWWEIGIGIVNWSIVVGMLIILLWLALSGKV